MWSRHIYVGEGAVSKYLGFQGVRPWFHALSEIPKDFVAQSEIPVQLNLNDN